MRKENFERVKEIMAELERVQECLEVFNKPITLKVSNQKGTGYLPPIGIQDIFTSQPSKTLEDIAQRFLYDYWNYYSHLKKKLISELETL